MTLFRVWAPDSGSVEVIVDGRNEKMYRDSGGWWRADVGYAAPGSRYMFSLDGRDPMPDPRSAFQPEGVHGPSEVIDHDDFDWSDEDWSGLDLGKSVIYELHIGTFTPEGTFAAAATKLDHLVALGIGAIEIMPPVEFPGERGWGYDGVALFAPHHAYGTPDELKSLIDASHSRGIAVVIDVVYNHLGPDGNYLAEYGPYFTDRYSTPWGDALNYDGAQSDEVRSFIIDNACMWFDEYHADGLRLDAVHAIYDFSPRHLLQELSEVAAARSKCLIAESNRNDVRTVACTAENGLGMDAQWSDDFHHSLHVALTGEKAGYYVDYEGLSDVVAALARTFVYDGRYSQFASRRQGSDASRVDARKFVGYLQDHDQVGNRANGERIAALVDARYLKAAAALVLLAPFVPMLFQGEEWGTKVPFLYFTDHGDPKLAKAVSTGRRAEFASFGESGSVPDPQDRATFQGSILDWAEVDTPDGKDLFAWYQGLIELRSTKPCFTSGRNDFSIERMDDSGIRMTRGQIVLLVNLGGVQLSTAAERAAVLMQHESTASVDGWIQLRPGGVVIFEKG